MAPGSGNQAASRLPLPPPLQIPRLEIPLHTLMELRPRPDGTMEARCSCPAPALPLACLPCCLAPLATGCRRCRAPAPAGTPVLACVCCWPPPSAGPWGGHSSPHSTQQPPHLAPPTGGVHPHHHHNPQGGAHHPRACAQPPARPQRARAGGGASAACLGLPARGCHFPGAYPAARAGGAARAQLPTALLATPCPPADCPTKDHRGRPWVPRGPFLL